MWSPLYIQFDQRESGRGSCNSPLPANPISKKSLWILSGAKILQKFSKYISRQKFLGRHNEILRIRKQQSNINATIGRLSSLLPALLEMKKLEAKMKLGKYYSALKIIQLIRHEHLENCRQVGRKITPGNQGPHFWGGPNSFLVWPWGGPWLDPWDGVRWGSKLAQKRLWDSYT